MAWYINQSIKSLFFTGYFTVFRMYVAVNKWDILFHFKVWNVLSVDPNESVPHFLLFLELSKEFCFLRETSIFLSILVIISVLKCITKLIGPQHIHIMPWDIITYSFWNCTTTKTIIHGCHLKIHIIFHLNYTFNYKVFKMHNITWANFWLYHTKPFFLSISLQIRRHSAEFIEHATFICAILTLEENVMSLVTEQWEISHDTWCYI